MSANQRFLIVKYAPDVRRMEPVNVGIVVWAQGRAEIKFLPAAEAAALVNDSAVYKRWVGHWSRMVAGEAIEAGGGTPVPKTSPQFVEELLKTQKGNYILADGGEIVDRITAKNIADATDYLFDELVARKGSHQPSQREQAVTLQYMSASILKETGITGHDEFQRSYPVTCRVGDFETELKVHYAIANGKPRSVFHRVQIGVTQSVRAASFMFEHLRKDAKLSKENCAALLTRR